MRKFNIDRINLKKIELGENPIILVKNTYDDLKIADGYLVDANGNRIGTKGDMYQKYIMDKIYQEGCLDLTPSCSPFGPITIISFALICSLIKLSLLFAISNTSIKKWIQESLYPPK